jgi:hypothetical protein
MIFSRYASFVEAAPEEALLRAADDVRLIIEACYSNGVDRALVHAHNLTPKFFDLSSGEAGVILQKLRTYKIRLAVVCRPGEVRFSTHFGEMAAEEARTGQFRLFESAAAGRAWLSGGK